MCVKAKGLENNYEIVLSSNCAEMNSVWEWVGGSLKLVTNGKCIHLLRSDQPAVEGKMMILHAGCDDKVNSFKRLGKFRYVFSMQAMS